MFGVEAGGPKPEAAGPRGEDWPPADPEGSRRLFHGRRRCSRKSGFRATWRAQELFRPRCSVLELEAPEARGGWSEKTGRPPTRRDGAECSWPSAVLPQKWVSRNLASSGAFSAQMFGVEAGGPKTEAPARHGGPARAASGRSLGRRRSPTRARPRLHESARTAGVTRPSLGWEGARSGFGLSRAPRSPAAARGAAGSPSVSPGARRGARRSGRGGRRRPRVRLRRA